MSKIKTRFVGLALSVVMAATSFTSTFAASTNSVTRIATVKEDSVITNVNLKITPKSEVVSGESIIISLENAEIDEDKIYDETGKTFEELTEYNNDSDKIKPYTIKKINKDEFQVFLGGISTSEVDSSDASPYYLIPIVAIANSKNDVKVTIDSNGTVISEGTFTIAKTTAKDGNTTTIIHEKKVFSDTLLVDTLTVKENVYGTFKKGEVKVRVNGGFKFVESDVKVVAGVNLDNSVSADVKYADNKSYFTFSMPEEWVGTDKASSFLIQGIKIEAEDDDKNYGDVKLTISGSSANITKETVVVGTRQDYGFEFEVIDEVPTILSGRTYYDNSSLDSDEFKTATVKFAELTADTWVTNRKLEFTVPDGVKIVDVDFDEIEEIENLDDSASIINKGQTLRLDRTLVLSDNRKDDDVASFEMNLFLSIDADFTGDVELSVKGGGIAEDALPAVTIAEAITPITIETDVTTANLGYQSFGAADITISETQEGALLDDEKVVILFDDKKFGNSELGFNDTNIEYAIDGELTISDFEVTNGAIEFEIDKSSYNEPASITISGITIGTTRSVPYGSFDIKVSGSAVVNNYKDKLEDIYPVKVDEVENKDNKDLFYFDTTDGYSYEDYIKIITFTGAYNSIVEVTIGSQAIKVNGSEYDVDVAPYIQTETASTMVPLRVIAVALFDGNVENADGSSNITFDADSKTATIFYNNRVIQFQNGSNYVFIDGTKVPCDNGAKAEIVNDRLFVPYRVLGNILNVPVTWNAETRTARYN